jgi:hypothetical protein
MRIIMPLTIAAAALAAATPALAQNETANTAYTANATAANELTPTGNAAENAMAVPPAAPVTTETNLTTTETAAPAQEEKKGFPWGVLGLLGLLGLIPRARRGS